MRLTRLLRQPLVPLVAALVALLLGYAQAYGPRSSSEDEVALVAEAYHQLRRSAWRDLDGQQLLQAGIEGMLETLDPHTHYLPEETFRYMQQEQEGEFFGIGVSFDVRDGYLTVVSPIEGTPAARAGILAGDRIVTIDGQDAVGITTSEVLNKLRGGKGEPVRIGILRGDSQEIREFELVRERIPLNSVRYAFMVEPGLAYVRVSNFAQSTARELQLELERLAGQGMKRLVLDLRGNSGGLLLTARQICGMFLHQGDEIVSTKGRIRGSNGSFTVKRDGAWSDLPLVVVVDRWSASASEILAAAIQDHDRGLLIGERTFGKGLVGSLYNLAHGSALQVTTAQYFTASGRFIQKPYDIPHRDEPPEPPPSTDGPAYTTEAGRHLAGGGGITPDVVVEEELLSDLMIRLDLEENLFFDFAVRLVEGSGEIPLDWIPSPAEVDRLIDRALELEDPPPRAELEAERDDLRHALRREVIGVAHGLEASYRVRLERSRAIAKAVELAPEIEPILAREIALAGR